MIANVLQPPHTLVKSVGGVCCFISKHLSSNACPITHTERFGPIAVFTPGLNRISKSRGLIIIPSILFALSHSPPAKLHRLSILERLSKNNGHTEQRGHDPLYTVLINFNSGFQNKRCRGSNYIKHICLWGRRGGGRGYSVLSAETETSVQKCLGDARALEQN